MSSTEFGPSVLYAFNDHVADYTWLRPYLGAGVNFYRSTITQSSIVGIETLGLTVRIAAVRRGRVVIRQRAAVRDQHRGELPLVRRAV